MAKKRDDGRYQSNIHLGYDPETGKRIYKTVYAHSKKHLIEQVSTVRESLRMGTYADDKGMTIGRWADTWFKLERAHGEVNTRNMYHRIVYTHIIPSIGNVRLKDLKKSDVQLMINGRLEHPRTCGQVKMTINQIIESAIDEGLVFKNVARKIIVPKYKPKPKRVLTQTEYKAIETAQLSDKERLFVYIIQYCGLRRGEALALSIGDVDMVNNLISVNNVIVFDDNTPQLKDSPKTSAGLRQIPMPNIVKDLLLQYCRSLDSLYLFEMDRKHGFMSKSSYTKFWKGIISKLNVAAGGNENLKVIYDLTAHIFRHNYATVLYYKEVDIKKAQYLLGHADVKVTLDIYTHMQKIEIPKEILERFVA